MYFPRRAWCRLAYSSRCGTQQQQQMVCAAHCSTRLLNARAMPQHSLHTSLLQLLQSHRFLNSTRMHAAHRVMMCRLLAAPLLQYRLTAADADMLLLSCSTCWPPSAPHVYLLCPSSSMSSRHLSRSRCGAKTVSSTAQESRQAERQQQSSAACKSIVPALIRQQLLPLQNSSSQAAGRRVTLGACMHATATPAGTYLPGRSTHPLCNCAGLLKRYGLDINSTDILQANLDSAGLPVSVVAEAAELNK